ALIMSQNKGERKDLLQDPIKKLSTKEINTAFSFTEKEKFKPEAIQEMLAASEKMPVYDLWSGGIRRMNNGKDLKENQGFSRMAAQFSKKMEDTQGRMYLEINLYGKDKFEMNIGAGHICPPSWEKVAIVDRSGKTKIGTRKIPGVDNVDGHKIGYYDEKGKYLEVYTGYKVYPLSVLSEDEKKDKQVIDVQVVKETKYYEENKKKLEAYVDRVSYSVAKMEMTQVEMQKIRDKIPGLEDIKEPGARVAAVAEWVAKNEDIYAKHCGNWVERVYAIAGVTMKSGLYHNMDYARENGQWKRTVDQSIVPDARNGKNALNERPDLVDSLQAGYWLYLNNRNSFDLGGNHSVIFIRWVDKENRIAECANWHNNGGGKNGRKGQKISQYDFKKYPITHITRAAQVEDKFTRLSDDEMKQKEETSQVEHAPIGDYKLDAQKYAKEVESKYGVPWQVTFGMSFLETGAGRSGLARNDNAFFGIKAKPGDINTTDYYKGDKYRKYQNMAESFMDYGRFVTKDRYTEALKYKNNPMMYLAVILGAGYCPGKEYFRKVVDIWKKTGISDIGYISKSALSDSLNNVAYRESRPDTYVLGLITPDLLEEKFYSVAEAEGKLRG
ncbi:glucosaminidase domain-containing protein, partial [Patescibacteria group bacterium]|nr:glucosaminidase domain-containing protein [Patescibacteria group bacterium]